jgi:Protein of unknown function (DUF4238)
LSRQPKAKNTHFVPQSYLRRFCSVSDRQVALYNLKSGRTVETAPIKTQCSRDYFYTKNPILEDELSKIEGAQKTLFDRIIATESVPAPGSLDRSALSSYIMLQAGRTVSTVEHADHLADQFGRAILRTHLEKEGRDDLLAVLPEVQISMPNAAIDAVGQHLAMYPLIDDLDCTLFINQTKEDFLTSDHPVVRCNNLPATSPLGANIGFSSRGLIIVFPLLPRALLFLSDREVYKIARSERGVAIVAKRREAVELNLVQCFNAHENLYFASSHGVQETLEAFPRRQASLRKARPTLKETPVLTDSGRKQLLLQMPNQARRLTLPKTVEIRHAVKKAKYVLGDALQRDPLRTAAVSAELDRLQELREQAMKRAEEPSSD